MDLDKALAYYEVEIIRAVKRFVVEAQRSQRGAKQPFSFKTGSCITHLITREPLLKGKAQYS